ncbi:MAG TPA: pyridoxamine 5'-phosphate oxidase family protein [Candidatus Woesebacteria bacterium]|nr:pyridoxamine 5'-phosphate oxidase family protein [Candidatus Woesebacteria bacterium]
MIDKKTVLEIVKKNSLCVLSTASPSGKTESAVMAHTVNDNLTVFMSTEETSRKIQNIKANNQASLLIGGLKNDPSLQIDGLATILEGNQKTEAVNFMLSVHPELKDYGIDSGCIFSITPQWVRYSDYTQNPPTIEEINF